MTDQPETACSLQFIGTATVLLRLGPFTVLTDPNFLHLGERAYLGHGLVSKRLTQPALSIEELPVLDAMCCPTCTGTTGTGVPAAGSTGERLS
jgi:hypothetical protein